MDGGDNGIKCLIVIMYCLVPMVVVANLFSDEKGIKKIVSSSLMIMAKKVVIGVILIIIMMVVSMVYM